jgi:fructosamine-3-kinase
VNEATRAAVGRALGALVTAGARRGGGDINDAFQLTLADGRRAFAKLNDRAPPGFFEAEARGLRWLAAAGALVGETRSPRRCARLAWAISGR